MEFLLHALGEIEQFVAQLGANLIPDVAPTCVKTLQIQNQRSRALLFVTDVRRTGSSGDPVSMRLKDAQNSGKMRRLLGLQVEVKSDQRPTSIVAGLEGLFDKQDARCRRSSSPAWAPGLWLVLRE